MSKDIKKMQEFVQKKCLSLFKVEQKSCFLPLWNLNFAVICFALDKSEHELTFDTFGRCWEKLGNTAITIEKFHWQMMVEGGYTVLFDGQSEKTQFAIARLLGWEGDE